MKRLVVPAAGFVYPELVDLRRKLEEVSVGAWVRFVTLPYTEKPVLVHYRAFGGLNRKDAVVSTRYIVLWLPAGEVLRREDHGFYEACRGPESVAQLVQDFACPLKFKVRRVAQDGDWNYDWVEAVRVLIETGHWELVADNMRDGDPLLSYHLPSCSVCQEAYLEGFKVREFKYVQTILFGVRVQ